jgi:hypothetical protein
VPSAAAFRTINHELHGAIPLPASAENLQENFSCRLNKGPSTIGLAGRQDLQKIALSHLLPGSADGSHKALVDLGDRCRLAGVISPQAGAAQSRCSLHCIRVVAYFVFAYTQYIVASMAIAPSAPSQMRRQRYGLFGASKAPFDGGARHLVVRS